MPSFQALSSLTRLIVMAKTSTETNGNGAGGGTDTMPPCSHPRFPPLKACYWNMGARTMCLSTFQMLLPLVDACVALSQRAMRCPLVEMTAPEYSSQSIFVTAELPEIYFYFLQVLTAFIKATKLKWKRQLLAKWNERVY